MTKLEALLSQLYHKLYYKRCREIETLWFIYFEGCSKIAATVRFLNYCRSYRSRSIADSYILPEIYRRFRNVDMSSIVLETSNKNRKQCCLAHTIRDAAEIYGLKNIERYSAEIKAV